MTVAAAMPSSILADVLPDQFAAARARERSNAFALVASGRAGSRRDISEILSLRSSTTSQIVSDLVERGLVLEATAAAAGRGRPAATLVLNPRGLTGIVIQIVSRSLVGSIVDLAGHVLAEHSVDIDRDCDNAEMAAALKSLAATLTPRSRRLGRHAGTVLSVAGAVDIAARTWLVSSRWPRLRALDLDACFQPAAGPLEVTRHLDAELRARSGDEAASRRDNLLLLHWGYGIGLACRLGGQPLGLAGGFLGEIGHWRLRSFDDRPCRCGQRGCVETSAALWALLPELRKRWPDLAADEGAFADRARDLDLLSLPAMAEATVTMAHTLRNFCRVIVPQRIIVTGPFVANAAIWARLNALFRQDDILAGLSPPDLVTDQASQRLERDGAARPLFTRTLAGLLGD